MKQEFIKFICLPLLYLSIIQPIPAQRIQTAWHGKISIGDNPVAMHGDMVLDSDGELYTGNGRLEITGRYRGAPGSKIFRSLTAGDVSRFLDISDGADGSTEIIPGMDINWDGSPIELVRAKQDNPDAAVFYIRPLMPDCGEYGVQLQHKVNENHSLWSVAGMRTLPLIKQLGNHTLLANNNSPTNGGYGFVYYKWYKNGQLLTEGSHDEYGGSYYTGGANLEPEAEYRVEAIDADGKRHYSCPYFYLPVEDLNVKVYPNPVKGNETVYAEVENGDEALLQNAAIEIHDYTGKYCGKAAAEGRRVIPVGLPPTPGVYILKFKAEATEREMKVIVK
jgi:hypothetical protein